MSTHINYLNNNVAIFYNFAKASIYAQLQRASAVSYYTHERVYVFSTEDDFIQIESVLHADSGNYIKIVQDNKYLLNVGSQKYLTLEDYQYFIEDMFNNGWLNDATLDYGVTINGYWIKHKPIQELCSCLNMDKITSMCYYTGALIFDSDSSEDGCIPESVVDWYSWHMKVSPVSTKSFPKSMYT